jgi:HEAT repeat protein
MKAWMTAVLVLVSQAAWAQAPADLVGDPLGLARLKPYAAGRVSSDNRVVFSNDDSRKIMPGETLVMADLTGPGMVTHMWITVADNEFAWSRLVRIRVYYDGRKTPSVDAPLGDFFGVGHGYERDLSTMMVRNSSFGRARNVYWPMPFRKACRITVTNEGARWVPMFYYQVDYRRYPSLPDDVGYFHAYYRQERPAIAGRLYEFVSLKGTGHYVGTVLNVIQSQVGWFGEGDDLFYVDGASHPQLYGTGSEDYFSDAWDLRVAAGLWSATPVTEGVRLGARLTGDRWHVPDPIPFTRSLWAGIEHAGWTYKPDGTLKTGFEERADYFSSVAFWYQTGVNEDLEEPPYGEARLPLGNAEQIAPETSIKEVTAQGGTASVQLEVDWAKNLVLFEAAGKDSRVNIPFEVGEAGRYEVIVSLAQAPNYGNYVALLDGGPTNLDSRKAATSEPAATGPEVYRNYLPEVLVAVDHPLGWFELTKGRHVISFVCVGKDERSDGYNLGVHSIVLERVPSVEPAAAARVRKEEASPGVPDGRAVYRGRPLSYYVEELTAAPSSGRADVLRAIGAFGSDAAPAVAALGAGLANSSPEARSAAAWALSQVGPGAAPAVPALARALADPSPRVRGLAAVALKNMGPHAAAAVPDLIRALDDPVDYVRFPVADAIGAIGAGASAAVPALVNRLQAKGETGLVLNRVALALGAIGPAARSALPALEQAISVNRLGTAAREAVLRIQGKEVPTWW